MNKLFQLAKGLSLINFAYCEDRKIPVCRTTEIEEGCIKSVNIGSKKYLLCKILGTIYCVSPKCPHQRGSLEGGFINGYNIVCPMHGAEFDVRTGHLINYPGLRPISSYKVTEKEDMVVVHLEKVSEKYDFNNIDNRHFIIIGAGAAGVTAAHTLRKEGFSGKISVFSNESTLPYDRVLLSKNFLLDKNDLILENEDFYAKNKIDLIRNTPVSSISKENITANNKTYEFDKLLIATGGSSKVQTEFKPYLNCSNILSIRKIDDYFNLKDQIAKANKICVIGNRFTGLECASNIKKTFPTKEITVVEYEAKALEKVIGPFLSSHVFESFANNEVRIVFGSKFEKFHIFDEKIVAVSLNSEKIDTDLVILATGSVLTTDFLPSDLKNDDGSVLVNENLRTSYENVFAAGDIAEFPSKLTNRQERIEH